MQNLHLDQRRRTKIKTLKEKFKVMKDGEGMEGGNSVFLDLEQVA